MKNTIKSFTLIAFILLSFSPLAKNQLITQPDTLKAYKHLLIADSLLESNHASSSHHLLKAAKSYEKANIRSRNLFVLNKLFNFYLKNEKLDSAEFTLNFGFQIIDHGLGENNLEAANTIANKGDFLQKKGQYNLATLFFKKSLKIKTSLLSENHPETLKAINLLAINNFYLDSYDSSIFFFEKAIEITKSLFGANSEKLAKLYSNMGNVYSSMDLTELSRKNLEKALEINLKHFGENHSETGTTYNNIGIIYARTGKYDSAALYLEKALHIRKKEFGENHSLVGASYNNLALVHRLNESYDIALSNSLADMRISKSALGEDHPEMAGTYSTLGGILSHLKKYDSAQYFYEKALVISQKYFSEPHSKLASAYNDLATLFNESDRNLHKLALTYYQKSLSNYIGVHGPENPHVATILGNMGMAHYYMRNYPQALELHKKALKMNLSFNNNPENIATNYVYLGQDLYKLKRFKEALKVYQQALMNRTRNYADTAIFSNPVIADAISKNELLKMLWFKGLILKDWYLNTQDFETAEFALQTFNRADTLIQELRQSQIRHDDKLALGQTSQEVYKKAIAICFALYKDTSRKKYLEMAFNFSEKAKAAVLSGNLLEKNARAFSTLPQELLKHENRIRHDIEFYQSKILGLNSHTEDSTQIEEMQKQVFALNRSLDSVKQIMREDYAHYYSLKYENLIFSIPEIQNRLISQQGLLEYFEGDSAIYAFIISKQEFDMYSFPKERSLLEALAASQKLYANPLNATDDRNKVAHFLYQALLEKPLDSRKPQINNLIIIPSSGLATVPWELLLTDDQGDSFKNLSFLLKDYTCSFAFSAALLFQKLKATTSYSKEVLAFAPVYENRGDGYNLKEPFRDEIVPLEWNLPEASSVIRALSGKVLTGKEATEKRFKEEASNYRVLHLAMHALVDHDESMKSKLVFTQDKDSIEDDLLHTFELFNMELPAEMVVLSACNTGIGKVHEGEGVMSLARAFAYAGVPSLVMSHWNVNDESTAKLMALFYRHLAAGQRKDEALRNAKLDFLGQANEIQADPFFWGSFILLGDTNPIETERNNSLFLVIIVVICCLSLYLIFRKRIMRSQFSIRSTKLKLLINDSNSIKIGSR